jgi:hypothetical protein
VIMNWRGCGRKLSWPILSCFFFCGIRELEKPVGAADNQDSIFLQHITAAIRNDICARPSTAAFRDGMVVSDLREYVLSDIVHMLSRSTDLGIVLCS